MNFELLGICYDKTQTLRKGASKAPDLIRKTFPKLETFINGIELSETAFIKDLGNIYPKNNKNMIEQTKKKLRGYSFPIILGGEHSISYATISALPNIKSFVCLDAHPDCENINKHDGVVCRIAETGKNVFLYGVRCFSKKESEFLKKSRIKIIRANQLKAVPPPAYLSIDFDVLDPSVLPAVGNPEPEGLSFQEIIEAVRILAPKISAIDFVEFTPLRSKELDEVYALLAGKLIYSAIAEIIKARK